MTPTTPPAMMGTVFKPDDEGRVRDCVGNSVEDVLEVVVIGADTLEAENRARTELRGVYKKTLSETVTRGERKDGRICLPPTAYALLRFQLFSF
jgi:hypothetical protein